MKYKELAEIKARRAEIAGLIDKASADELRALNTELDELTANENEINARSAARAKAGGMVEVPKPEERGQESEMEKRGRELLQGRSVTVATEGVLLAEHQSTTIRPTFNEVSTLIDRVNALVLMGGESFQQPYEKGYGTGGYTDEAGDPTVAEPTFGYAEVKKTKITAYAEITEELLKLPAADFAGVVMRGVPLAIRKKITKEILVGDGASGHFVGIFDDGATAIDQATDIAFSEIDENTLDEIIYSYGGDENVEDVSVLILSKPDLKAFAQLRDANGRKIHEVKTNGNSGTIDSVPFIINSACKAISSAATTSGSYAMCYGPLVNYTMGIFSGMELSRSADYKFKEGMIAHRGVIFAGGNVTAKNGFLRVKKA